MFTFANNILIINKNNVTIMGILFFICIIVVITIYCLLKPSKQSPTPPISSTTPINLPTPSTKPTKPTGIKKDLLGPCVEEVWSLTEFTKKFDRMKVGDCTNHDTGEVFKSCIFFKDNTSTFVYFYKTIGVLTKEEISKRKDELKVGRTPNNKYYLYTGEDNFAENVNLGINNYEQTTYH